MDKERETLWREHWREAKAAKAARRKANREGWANSPTNAMSARNATVELEADPLAAVDDAMTSASLKKLRELMFDNKKPLYRRLDAAEVVLSYELGPGSAAGADPDTVAAKSFQFLKLVADAPDTPEALAFRALKCIAGIENARATIRNSAEQLHDKKALLVACANAERRMHLMKTGQWPPREPIRWLDVADPIALPSSWIAMAWPPAVISSGYRKGKGNAAAFSAMLRGIRSGPDDDFWERYAA